ncbi:MAG TPA: DUF2249 domain-containing protein [Usitatibacter sp.]|jgi:hypothetical protein|nr:DUF2249 domain-containing protein [Usitatibacter sp.]
MSQPVDLRSLDPPEPLVRILAAIEDASGPRVFLLSREPYPLYALLAAAGWRHEVRREAGDVVLTVSR